MKNKVLVANISLWALMLAGCSAVEIEPFQKPLRAPVFDQDSTPAASAGEKASVESTSDRFSVLPRADITHTKTKGGAVRLGDGLAGDPIAVSFSDVPLVAFINEVFGTELNMSFVISPDLQNKRDLVTLRLTEPLAPKELFATARTVLEQYGVGIKEKAGLLQFLASQEILTDEVPLLISGRSLPDVPSSHRTIFQMVPLKVVRNPQVNSLLKQAFKGRDLVIIEDPSRNAIVLKGAPDIVAQAVEMIDVLDQPVLKSRHSLLVAPLYITSEELANELEKVLKAEGFEPSQSPPLGSLILLALEEANKLLVFAADQKVIAHVKRWIRLLDEERLESISEGFFTYEVKHAQAKELASTLEQLWGGRTSGTGKSGSGAQAMKAVGQGPMKSGIIVDENRNLLIYKGAGAEWNKMKPVINELDKPTPSVLIEVLLAEVSLTEGEGSGFGFLFNSNHGRFGLSGGTLDAGGLTSKGLSMVLDNAGATRAVLNMFYEDSRVVIRSSPKILVKSGGEAKIEVGNEIPVITQNSTADSTSEGTTNILQEISYRKTGVILNVKPIVQAGGIVDLSISQELSEARPTDAASLSGSPTILNRKVETELVLKDGGSLLMGGIISNSQSSGGGGVTGLGRIPWLGSLFNNKSYTKDRTELMILVIPYVIKNSQEGWDLTEQFKSKLGLHNNGIEKLGDGRGGE